jgi:hypothetical protein
MSAALSATTRRRALGWFDESLRRQNALTLYALVLLMLLVPVLAASIVDPRMIDGDSVWAKPAKFLFSLAVYALTFAWLAGYVAPEKRNTRLMRGAVATVIAASTFELLWIGWQGANGMHSHYNEDTTLFAVMYALMGVFAVLLVAALAPLAYQVWRHPAKGMRPEFRMSVIVGLTLTIILGGGLGIYMSQQTGHAVGASGGQVPIFGWNRMGGDLRVAHFLGIHTEQVIPLLGAAVADLKSVLRWGLVIAGTLAYAALTLATFVQALSGRPLFPL